MHVHSTGTVLTLAGFEASLIYVALRDLHKAKSELFDDTTGYGIKFEVDGVTYRLQDAPEGSATILTITRE